MSEFAMGQGERRGVPEKESVSFVCSYVVTVAERLGLECSSETKYSIQATT